MIVYKDVDLINGCDNRVEKNTNVVVEGNKISYVGSDIGIPEDARVIEAKGQTLMPGLIDCHVHLDLGAEMDFPGQMLEEPAAMCIVRATERLGRYLPAGFTTIRVNGGLEHMATSLRDAVKNKIIKGPRIVAAGKYLSITGGHGQFFKTWVSVEDSLVDMVDGPEEIRKAIRTQIANGVDVIKFFNTGGVMDSASNPNGQEYTDEELSTIVSEAKKGGKRTSTHAHGVMGIKSAIKAGVDSIEHASMLDDECIEMLKESDSFIVPTLSPLHWIIAKGNDGGLPDYVMNKAKDLSEVAKNSFRMAYESKVNVAMGTDSGTPFNFHGKNALELELMTKNGMSPIDAIITATKKSAENLGLADSIGTIEVGKLADLILIDGDPLSDITLLQNESKIKVVMKEGEVEVDRM